MKKLLSVLLVFTMLFGLGVTVTAQSETEIPEGYTPIYTAEDLNNIRNNLSGKYILMNDIDLSVYENWEPIGTQETPFTGEINGNGFLIENLTITSSEETNVGLLGSSDEAILDKILLVNTQFTLNAKDKTSDEINVGAVVGRARYSKISNCSVTGKISVNGFYLSEIGGIVGLNVFSDVTRCSNYADLSVDNYINYAIIYIGGIEGECFSESDLSECCNFGNITVGENAKNDIELYAGGIFGGFSADFSVINCYNRGNIHINCLDDYSYVGGIAGISVIIEKSYSTGKIIVNEDFEGFCGNITGNILCSLFATPGYTDGEKLEDVYYLNNGIHPCFYDRVPYDEVSPRLAMQLFFDLVSLSEEQMKEKASFSELDFENIWSMEENGYPVLQNQPMINVKEEISLEVGETFDGDLTDCEWSIEDENIVNVDENNNIIALSAGETVVTVEIEYGYSYEYTVTVTEPVTDPEPKPEPEPPVVEPNEDCCIIKVFKKLCSFILFLYKSIVGFFNL